MKKFNVTVIRKQSWIFNSIEAEDEDEAKERADMMAYHEEPHDSWAYDTIATEVNT